MLNILWRSAYLCYQHRKLWVSRGVSRPPAHFGRYDWAWLLCKGVNPPFYTGKYSPRL